MSLFDNGVKMYFDMNKHYKMLIGDILLYYAHQKSSAKYFAELYLALFVRVGHFKLDTYEKEIVDKFLEMISKCAKFNNQACLVMNKLLPTDIVNEMDETLPLLYCHSYQSETQHKFNEWSMKYLSILFERQELWHNIFEFFTTETHVKFDVFLNKQSRLVGDILDEFLFEPNMIDICYKHIPQSCEGYLNMIYKQISRTIEHFNIVFKFQMNIAPASDGGVLVSVIAPNVPKRYYDLSGCNEE